MHAVLEGTVTHPCGHVAGFGESCGAVPDAWCCPVCGLAWRVDQVPSVKWPSGWVEPGRRAVVVEAQRVLALEFRSPAP